MPISWGGLTDSGREVPIINTSDPKKYRREYASSAEIANTPPSSNGNGSNVYGSSSKDSLDNVYGTTNSRPGTVNENDPNPAKQGLI